MATKKIVVDTHHKPGQIFKVSESRGCFHVYDVGGLFSYDRKIGEASTLEDAIHLIKADLGCEVHNIRIKEW